MMAATHALVGGIIASSINNPPLGLTLSAISHPLLDLIPHWDLGQGWRQKSKKKLFTECMGDLGAGVVLAYLIFGSRAPLGYLSACIFVSLIWDFLESPYWFLRWNFPPFSWIYSVQSRLHWRAGFLFGVTTQIITILIILGLLKILA